jgi:hypothetical protein
MQVRMQVRKQGSNLACIIRAPAPTLDDPGLGAGEPDTEPPTDSREDRSANGRIGVREVGR